MTPSAAVVTSALPLDATIADAAAALAALQRPDGHWNFELEADATIPAEWIFLGHFIGDIDAELEAKVARHLRSRQSADGSWPLFFGGDGDLSASVKAYFALKLAGDAPELPHMLRAREWILQQGGAAKANVFTRIALALFGQVPWRAVPVMPVEIMLLPRWFPFHLRKIAYWSRTVVVPLLILMALKPPAANPRGVGIRELFAVPPERERRYHATASRTLLGRAFLAVDGVLRRLDPWMPKKLRQRAIAAAVKFVRERLNGEDGLGGIFPAMANAVMAFHALGTAPDDPDWLAATASVRKLITFETGEPAGERTGERADETAEMAYCQSCLSPVWDTCLAAHALLEAGARGDDPALTTAISTAMSWLRERQILEVRGDWAWMRPHARPGGWAFQYRNDFYPDVDDTAVVGMALHRVDAERHAEAISRAAEWIIGMQSRNGGWGAFDADNTALYLNHIPFADHGALLDPPTADVTARCVGFLCQIGHAPDSPVIRRAVAFLLREQEADGSWFGRWGMNYMYGTWSVLGGLRATGMPTVAPPIARAVEWLKSRQREDGGWGEDGASYWPHRKSECHASTPSQTAWAVLGLMAGGEIASPAVARGVEFLQSARRNGAKWAERRYTAVGFPRVFYLRYDGYSAYFPLWALARYARLRRDSAANRGFGM